jgi:hypothetical protein
MSKEAIQAVVQELELLPEADQRLVLAFLAKLRRSRHASKPSMAGNRSALQRENGLLVFTGHLEQPDTDWVKAVREQRDDDLMNAALGRPARS